MFLAKNGHTATSFEATLEAPYTGDRTAHQAGTS